MNFNKAMIGGRLGKDPELKQSQGGTAVCKFSVATSERRGSGRDAKEVTTWHNVIAFGKTAELIAKFFSKGKPIFIEGRIDNSQYEDKQGNKRSFSQVIVDRFCFVGSKSDSDSGSAAPRDDSPDDIPF